MRLVNRRRFLGSTGLGLAAIGICLTAVGSGRAAPPTMAEERGYLAELVGLMDVKWPDNRAVNIVCHGHSVPAGYFQTPVVDTFNAYPHLLHRALKAAHPYAVINVIVTAIGGENSASGAQRFERDVLALRPDVVTIDYGLNDRGIGLDPARKAWSAMIEQALARGAKVVLLTPTADVSAKLDDPNDPLNQHAAQIRELAARYHVGLVDSLAAFQAYVRAGGKLADIMSSGNHPNRTGHEIVVRETMRWFAAAAPPLTKTTHAYKTVGDVKIAADVYRPDGNEKRPVVVWIHGGALIVGGRSGVPKNLLEFCTVQRLVLVSLDYRLAPEVKLPEIAADLVDAFRWLHEQGPTLLHADTSHIVVAGGSAGGYLTELAGAIVRPRPTALVAYWGYGEIDGPWATTPSEHHGAKLRREDVLPAVGKHVLANTDDPAEGKGRSDYYRFLRQTGQWSREVSGFDPTTDAAKLAPFCPVHNITADYPPILMVHGTLDTDVRYSCSVDMDRELSRNHVRHELISVPNAEHGLRDGDPRLVIEAHAQALRFIAAELGIEGGPAAAAR